MQLFLQEKECNKISRKIEKNVNYWFLPIQTLDGLSFFPTVYYNQYRTGRDIDFTQKIVWVEISVLSLTTRKIQYRV